jgi:hypothetical protein
VIPSDYPHEFVWITPQVARTIRWRLTSLGLVLTAWSLIFGFGVVPLGYRLPVVREPATMFAVGMAAMSALFLAEISIWGSHQ